MGTGIYLRDISEVSIQTIGGNNLIKTLDIKGGKSWLDMLLERVSDDHVGQLDGVLKSLAYILNSTET